MKPTPATRKQLVRELEDRFGDLGLVACWDVVRDPDDGAASDVLLVLNVPTARIVEVDRCAYDLAYALFDTDWDFLIDVRDRREVERSGVYFARFRQETQLRLANTPKRFAPLQARTLVRAHCDPSPPPVGYWDSAHAGFIASEAHRAYGAYAYPMTRARTIPASWAASWNHQIEFMAELSLTAALYGSVSYVVSLDAGRIHGPQMPPTNDLYLAANTHYSLAA